MTNNNQDVLDEFDKQFPYDSLVSAHQDWSYDAIKAFISQKLTERTRQVIETLDNEAWDESGKGDWLIDWRTEKQSLKSRFLDQEVGEKE